MFGICLHKDVQNAKFQSKCIAQVNLVQVDYSFKKAVNKRNYI